MARIKLNRITKKSNKENCEKKSPFCLFKEQIPDKFNSTLNNASHAAHELFSLFTANIIKENILFTR